MDPKSSVAYEDFGDARMRHLEMIQAVVSRLATSSFLIKGWALTSAGLFLAFSVETGNALLSAVSLVLTVGFWVLDTTFLRSERLFRALFNRVRIGNDYPPFYMSATSPGFAGVARREDEDWRRILRRRTLSLFYGPIAAATLLMALALWLGGSTPDEAQAPASSSPAPLQVPGGSEGPAASHHPTSPSSSDHTPSASQSAAGPSGT